MTAGYQTSQNNTFNGVGMMTKNRAGLNQHFRIRLPMFREEKNPLSAQKPTSFFWLRVRAPALAAPPSCDRYDAWMNVRLWRRSRPSTRRRIRCARGPENIALARARARRAWWWQLPQSWKESGCSQSSNAPSRAPHASFARFWRVRSERTLLCHSPRHAYRLSLHSRF